MMETNWWQEEGPTSIGDPITSVTILGNLLDFGQLFKAFGNN